MLGEHFGHNRFEEAVYRVPFFAVGVEPERLETIHTHEDIYRLIRESLGWECAEREKNGTIHINGSMQNGEDGYFELVPNEAGGYDGTRKWYQ
jgi:hypothetical protein